MNVYEDAVVRCREIIRAFVLDEIDYASLREKIAKAWMPLDPLDWAMEELSDELGREAEEYEDWLGGKFGEFKDRIPRRKDWVYGESNVPYGWIDEAAYREVLREALAGLLQLDA